MTFGSFQGLALPSTGYSLSKPVAEIVLADAPAELQDGITEFFPGSEWDNLARLSYLESKWNAFAVLDTASSAGGCGIPLGDLNGVPIVSERSVGYFSIDSCLFPDWEWQRLYNARHNCGTAHLIWVQQGYWAWYFSAVELGLISP